MAFLALQPYLTPLGRWEFVLRVGVLTAVLFYCREVIDLRVRYPLATIGLGILVFVVWIGPDLLIPGYRQHWLFSNPVTGSLSSSLCRKSSAAARLVNCAASLVRGWLLALKATEY